MKKRSRVILALILLMFFGLDYLGHAKSHFDFAAFRAEVVQVDWVRIALAICCVFTSYLLRSTRWAQLMRHTQKIGPFTLLGPQVIGFAAIGLIGRVADFARPFMIAKKAGTPVSEQFAVYVIERMADCASMALIFCTVLICSPTESMLHGEMIRWMAYAGLIATAIEAMILVVVRFSAARFSALVSRFVGIFSKDAARRAGERIRRFQAGLDIIKSFRDFASLASLSLATWLFITAAYILTAQAFLGEPHLVSTSAGRGVVLMAFGGGTGLVQLPVIGWFAKIGFFASLVNDFFAVPLEAATAFSAMVLMVTSLSVIPVGLIWSHLQQVSLRGIAAECEQESAS